MPDLCTLEWKDDPAGVSPLWLLVDNHPPPPPEPTDG